MKIKKTLPAAVSKVLSNFTRFLYAQKGLGEVTVNNHISAMRRLIPVLGGLHPSAEIIETHIMKMRKKGDSYSHITNTSVALERYCEFLKIQLTLGRPKKPKRLVSGTLSEAEITLLLAATRTLRQRTNPVPIGLLGSPQY
jgi:hypothetical protein